jgi:hypothetical protein
MEIFFEVGALERDSGYGNELFVGYPGQEGTLIVWGDEFVEGILELCRG